jgi:DNA-binding CsgD family transcriptional regulator
VHEVVSREEELGSLRAFIEDATNRPAALVLEGEAGIGKSTLWAVAVDDAAKRGSRVLAAQPAEPERGLAHIGLSDLFEDVLDEVLPALPPPRRRALEVALLREDVGRERVDPRALGLAVRTAIDVLAADAPLLLAIDDVQWLDASSVQALAFAWRRLSGSQVALLLAARRGEQGAVSELERRIGADEVQRLRLEPLSLGAVHRLLRNRSGGTFARQTLLRIHTRSGGNPFFALELARVHDPEDDQVQQLPATLEQLVRARISGLPKRTRKGLALAAAVGTTSEALLKRAGVPPTALDPAVAAHVIERHEGTVRFTHPLLSSVLYADLGDGRRAVHATIAAVAEDPLLEARHLALSKDRPDEAVARVLDEAAALAGARGAMAEAAELAEHALRLTPPARHGERYRRTLDAAHGHHAAGEWTRARALASGLLEAAEVAHVRAEAFVLLAELGTVAGAVELLEQALEEARSLPALQAEIHCRLAWATRFGVQSDHAGRALELAERLDDDQLRVRARVVQAILDWFAGAGETPQDLHERVREFAPAVGGQQLVQEATLAIANTLAPRDTREIARAFFVREQEEWGGRDEPRAARALWGLAWVEFWAGRWQVAAAHAAAAQDISLQYGLEVPQDHLPIAVVAVHRGDLALARSHAERALELAEHQLVLQPPQHMAVLGLAALWGGDASGGEEWLEKADRRAAELRWGEPSVRWWTPDYVELLLGHGRTDDARRVISTWGADAARVGRPWVLAQVTRCDGLLAAACGDVDQGDALLAKAVVELESVGDVYGRARALLNLGELRRGRQLKRSARETISEALHLFEELGAATWIEQAHGALGRIGGRTREDGLTASEQRVALLVANGGTNREVAKALFLGERTVASHLTHIYAKLGVRSRTELARRLL